MRLPLLLAVVLVTGCDNAPGNGGSIDLAADGAVLPDTQTIDDVLVMRHDADAFARAPVWTLDSVPQVVIDGGEEFDLTLVHAVTPLSDGRFIAFTNSYGARMMLFGRDGRPERYLARTGEGPGELSAAIEPIVVAGDTIVVVDESNRTTNWYHPDAGLLRSERTPHPVSSCFYRSGQLGDRRLVATWICLPWQLPEDGTTRPPIPLVTADLDFGRVDTLTMIPGYEMVDIETRRRGRRAVETTMLRFGRRPSATAVDSSVLVATGEAGYVIDVLREDGGQVSRVEVLRPRRPVTAALRERAIAAELARIDMPGREGRVDSEEDRRLAREAPFPDSLPPYGNVLAGADGVFWVVDYHAPGDSTWTATAFRLDGAVLGRLSGTRNPDEPGSGPIWFGRDRVIVREVDGDGVVGFGVYGVKQGELN